MKVNQSNFVPLYTARAASFLAKDAVAQTPNDAPPIPADTFLGKLKSWVGLKPTPAVRQSQNHLAVHTAVKALGGPTALALAQEIGLQLDDGKNADGETFKASQSDKLDLNPEHLEKRDRIWSKIAQVTGTTFETPTLLNGPGNGPGRFVGKSLFADGETLAGLPDEVALFYTAHEVGHLEHGDDVRKQGMTNLKSALPTEQRDSLTQARRDADWEMEFGADARAAEIAAQADCDPRPILRDLMQEPSGQEHPAGLERAARVRNIMATNGKPVSDEEWTAMVLQTAPSREAKQQAQNEAADMLLTFQNLV